MTITEKIEFNSRLLSYILSIDWNAIMNLWGNSLFLCAVDVDVDVYVDVDV
jgi:hypothetical protein